MFFRFNTKTNEVLIVFSLFVMICLVYSCMFSKCGFFIKIRFVVAFVSFYSSTWTSHVVFFFARRRSNPVYISCTFFAHLFLFFREINAQFPLENYRRKLLSIIKTFQNCFTYLGTNSVFRALSTNTKSPANFHRQFPLWWVRHILLIIPQFN